MELHASVRVTIDLDPNGTQKTKTKISASTVEDRDECQTRLRNALPGLELLEAALQKPTEPDDAPRA